MLKTPLALGLLLAAVATAGCRTTNGTGSGASSQTKGGARVCSDLKLLSLEPKSVAVGHPETVLLHGSGFRSDDYVMYVSSNAKTTVKSDSLIAVDLADEDTASARRITIVVHGLDGCLSGELYLEVK